MTRTDPHRTSRIVRRRFSSGTLNQTPNVPKSAPLLPRRTFQRPMSLSPPNGEDQQHLRRRHKPLGLSRSDGSESDDEDDRRERPSTAFDFRDTTRSLSPKPLFGTDRPTGYSSLPPTPILRPQPETPPTPLSPLVSQFNTPEQPKVHAQTVPFSLWDYLREELLATDFDSHQEQKWERVSNFLSMPWAMEKVSFSSFCRELVLIQDVRLLALVSLSASTPSSTLSLSSPSASSSRS